MNKNGAHTPSKLAADEVEFPFRKENAPRFRSDNWSHRQKEVLISLIQEQHMMKNFNGSNPTRTAWNKIMNAFNNRLQMNQSTQQLKEAWKNMKRNFKKYHSLATKTECGWNYERGLPEAPEEVWKELLQLEPALKSLRRRPFPFYQAMEILTQNSFVMDYHRSSVSTL